MDNSSATIMHDHAMVNIALFASGTGSNFEAIADAIDRGDIPAQIALLVCDKVNAKVIEKAQNRGISTFVFSAKDYQDKADYERDILLNLQKYEVKWIVLAGFMRLIGETLLGEYPRKIINVHPSLLPAYAGKDAIERAFNASEKVIGISIHYVDEGMDTGEIIAQEKIVLTGDETLEMVISKIHLLEHTLYPQTLRNLLTK